MATPRKIPINRINSDMIIYKTINLINGKIYIGQDSKNNPNYLGSGDLLKSAILKYGKENFKKEILCYCSDQKDLDDKEIFYINEHNSTNKEIGYNIAVGGRGGTMSNRKHSKESKIKISNSHKGKILSKEHRHNLSEAHKGKSLSDEHKNKIGKAHKGRNNGPLSEEHKNKISKAHKGKTLSEEVKVKMSESHKGVNNHFYGSKHTEEVKNVISKKNSKKVYQYDISGNLIKEWDSLTNCSNEIGVSVSHLSYCVKNYKNYKNYIFSYE